MKNKIIILILLVICLSLMACSNGDSPQGVTEQPVEIDQENTETANTVEEQNQFEGTPVTHIDQIVGTWIASADLGNYVTTIFPDGKFSVAPSLVALEAGSTDSWQLTIEDGQINATGVALCLGDTGMYLAMINQDGTLKFTTIIDACDSRLRKMDRSLPGRLTPYNLVYYRVE
jgi:hypothetical protein